MKKNDLPATGFLRIRDVLRFFPVSRSTWYSGINQGIYPKPVQLANRCSAWRAEDIRALIEKLGNPDDAA